MPSPLDASAYFTSSLPHLKAARGGSAQDLYYASKELGLGGSCHTSSTMKYYSSTQDKDPLGLGSSCHSTSTISTVDSEFSEASEHAVSRRRRLRKVRSAELTSTQARGRNSNARSTLRKVKSVQFACDKDGQIIPEEREFTIYLDHSLWWNRQDLEQIIDACWEIVEQATADGKGPEELRGLEKFVLETRADTAEEYRRLVLSGLQGLQFTDERLRVAARKVSRKAEKVAWQTAKLDMREALKAALT